MSKGPRAIRGRIIVEPIAPAESKTPGGVLLADTQVNPRTKQGRVVAVGESVASPLSERTEQPALAGGLNVGDEVVYDTKYAIPTVIDARQYVVLKEDDVLAIV